MNLQEPNGDAIGKAQTAARLERLKGEIIRQWEERSRAEVPAARAKDSSTVQNELTKFLDALIKELSPEFPEQIEEQKRIAVLHGQQRSGLTDYTLSQVLKEFALLREVLFDVLENNGPLSRDERKIIHRALDSAVQLAGDEFAKAEKAALKLALAKAEQSNKDLDQFAAVVAHDLRSPLATIAGFVEVIEEECASASPGARDAMLRIQAAVRRLLSFIDGVLGYARLSSVTPDFTAIQASDAVQSAMQNLRSQLTESGGRVQHDHLPLVLANLPLLTQVFQNLFANSIKFRAADPPVIHVSVEDTGDEWKFAISDNGVGFDPCETNNVFGFRTRLPMHSQLEGAGIGLATCRRLVEIHGGKVWAESSPGKGSIFFFTLPKAR